MAVAAFILTGCGGSPAPKAQAVTVRGVGFSFQAPAGWHAASSAGRASASHGDEFLQVTTFPLQKRYRPALFARVASELRQRMEALASQTGGKVAGESTVSAAGVRSHGYRVVTGDRVDEYTFVLRGLREYQLLCHHTASESVSPCAQLVASFKTAS